jgi:hypothetical protein
MNAVSAKVPCTAPLWQYRAFIWSAATREMRPQSMNSVPGDEFEAGSRFHVDFDAMHSSHLDRIAQAIVFQVMPEGVPDFAGLTPLPTTSGAIPQFLPPLSPPLSWPCSGDKRATEFRP